MQSGHTGVVVENEWEFTVEESFNITGRGTGVVGELVGMIERSGDPATLHVDGTQTRVDEVFVEVARVAGGERLALTLYGLTKEQVPPGAVLRGPTP